MNKSSQSSWYKIILPGLLVAATGVGAGDLATASFTGSQLGVSILWAVIVGGIFKYVLTEGIARWQLVTGKTFIEGITTQYPWIVWIFLPYLFLWSFFVGSALMSACGVTLHAIFPIFENASQAKIYFGIASSFIGYVCVLKGGFRLFEKVMSICIFFMFVTVLITAFKIWPNTQEIIQGLFIPHIPYDSAHKGIHWTVALIGGIGGTLTILCYGYWIKEEGRQGSQFIRLCRYDLAIGYSMTVLFGIAMVIIGSSIELNGKGARLLILLSERLETFIGPQGKWLFLIGAFGAIFSSLLGVWQSIPYLFSDLWFLLTKQGAKNKANLTESKAYKFYLLAISIIPSFGLWLSFKEVQKVYAIIGALFIPLLAIALFFLNNQSSSLNQYKNKATSKFLLLTILSFFIYIAFKKWTT